MGQIINHMPRHENLDIDLIRLDIDNPRIKNYLETYDRKSITAVHIALALSSTSSAEATTSFTSLRDSIKKCGGIIHPIIVSLESDGTYVAIEGNTRLQIYKDFKRDDPSGPWNSIPAIVYENLSPEKKHEIRLQSHLVGPRAWDPFSKAKYLYELSEVEHMPLKLIVSLCGGGKTEIERSIAAYKYMISFYHPYIKTKRNRRPEVREYSKFYEFQSSTIQHAIVRAGYELSKFAEWVVDGNIDTAQRVRILPKVLANSEAKARFLKTNLAEAEKVLNAAELDTADLSKYPYYVLASQLYKKIVSGEPSIEEMKSLAAGETDEAVDRMYHLGNLEAHLQIMLKTIHSL